MYFVYVLKSLKNGRRYVGFTSKLPQERLKAHHFGGSAWTSQNGPFKLIYTETFPSEREARRRERFFKTGNGRKFLDRHIDL